ncbi:MAG: hypothetical protein ACRERE_08610 [Candidatus Entotheonellia bacterium]
MVLLEEFPGGSLLKMVDQVDELRAAHFAGAPLVNSFGKREARTTEFFLMGTPRHLTQGTLHSLWHVSHNRHPLLVTDNPARPNGPGVQPPAQPVG